MCIRKIQNRTAYTFLLIDCYPRISRIIDESYYNVRKTSTFSLLSCSLYTACFQEISINKHKTMNHM